MSSDNIETRRRLKSIPDLSGFESLLNASTLSDLDKEIMRMHYLKEQDFRYIGDMIGLSESAVKSRHRKILNKLSRLF